MSYDFFVIDYITRFFDFQAGSMQKKLTMLSRFLLIVKKNLGKKNYTAINFLTFKPIFLKLF